MLVDEILTVVSFISSFVQIAEVFWNAIKSSKTQKQKQQKKSTSYPTLFHVVFW